MSRRGFASLVILVSVAQLYGGGHWITASLLLLFFLEGL
jgi:hypothetical protein